MRTRRPARLEAVSPVPGRWVEVDLHPTPEGGLSVAFRDINGRRLAEERQRLLVAELTHRIKNTLALVLAVADQTRRTVSSPDAFHAVFRDRFAALARAHDALRRDGETGTTLEAVAREALAPYGAGGGRGRAAGGGRRPGGAALVRGGGGARDGVPRACDQRRQAWGAVGPRRAGAAVLGRGGGGCGRRPLARGAVGGGRRAVHPGTAVHGAASARGCWSGASPRRSAAPFRSTSLPPACAAASGYRPTMAAARRRASRLEPTLRSCRTWKEGRGRPGIGLGSHVRHAAVGAGSLGDGQRTRAGAGACPSRQWRTDARMARVPRRGASAWNGTAVSGFASVPFRASPVDRAGHPGEHGAADRPGFLRRPVEAA